MTKLLLLLAIWGYVWLAPFTKVEESFNMQAMHDMLYHRGDFKAYDHNKFPGAVPRTFVGSGLVSLVSYPVVQFLDDHLPLCEHFHALIVVRMVLGLFTWLSLSHFSTSLEYMHGRTAASFFLLTTLTQFHILFYASRAIPNTFAFILVTLGVSFWVRNGRPGDTRIGLTDKESPQITSCLWCFTLAIVIFRSDAAVLFAPILLLMILTGELGFLRMVGTGLKATLFSVAITIGFDSQFWGRWEWPEFQVLYQNTVMGISEDWGTSPWHWYFTTALPMMLYGGCLLLPLAFLMEMRFRKYTVAAFLFVSLYSILGHKEKRFIFYAIPIFNAHVSILLGRWWAARQRSLVRSVLAFGALLIVLAGIAPTAYALASSMQNYPGGWAISELHQSFEEDGSGHPATLPGVWVGTHYELDSPASSVHIDMYSAKAGITRFQKNYCLNYEGNRLFSYSKDEKFKGGSAPYDYLITEDPDRHKGFYETIRSIDGFSGINRSWRGSGNLLKMDPKVFVMKRIRRTR